MNKAFSDEAFEFALNGVLVRGAAGGYLNGFDNVLPVLQVVSDGRQDVDAQRSIVRKPLVRLDEPSLERRRQRSSGTARVAR
jgi:hypothetical protein